MTEHNWVRTVCQGVAKNNYSMGFTNTMLRIFFMLDELRDQANELGLDPKTISFVKGQVGKLKDNVDDVVTQFN